MSSCRSATTSNRASATRPARLSSVRHRAHGSQSGTAPRSPAPDHPTAPAPRRQTRGPRGASEVELHEDARAAPAHLARIAPRVSRPPPLLSGDPRPATAATCKSRRPPSRCRAQPLRRVSARLPGHRGTRKESDGHMIKLTACSICLRAVTRFGLARGRASSETPRTTTTCHGCGALQHCAELILAPRGRSGRIGRTGGITDAEAPRAIAGHRSTSEFHIRARERAMSNTSKLGPAQRAARARRDLARGIRGIRATPTSGRPPPPVTEQSPGPYTEGSLTAEAVVEGGRAAMAANSDGLLEVDLSVPATMSGDDGPGTNPDLFAVGFAACFQSALLGVARGRSSTRRIAHDITGRYRPTRPGGFGIQVSPTSTHRTSLQRTARPDAASGDAPLFERNAREHHRRASVDGTPSNASVSTAGMAAAELRAAEVGRGSLLASMSRSPQRRECSSRATHIEERNDGHDNAQRRRLVEDTRDERFLMHAGPPSSRDASASLASAETSPISSTGTTWKRSSRGCPPNSRWTSCDDGSDRAELETGRARAAALIVTVASAAAPCWRPRAPARRADSHD